MINTFDGKTPQIGERSYVHPRADVLGNVKIGADCWIGPGARIRGDYGRVIIGNNTSVEDNSVIHARPNGATTIGDWVTVGHGAIVHNATVEDWAVVGSGCVVCDFASLGKWCVVMEGSVVRQRQEIPHDVVAEGSPAQVVDNPVSKNEKAEWTCVKKTYVDLAWLYHTALT